MFYIRTDANEIIASGHLMRCLSIAKALRKQGEDTTFLTADDYAEGILQREGFRQIVLHSSWNCLEEELMILEPIIREQEIDSLLVDSYQVTVNYLSRLQKLTEIIYLDDYANQIYPVDILINYAFCCPVDYYSQQYKNSQVQLLLGSRYAPLREEFWNVKPHEIKEQIRDVLITTGGTDPYRIEEHLAEMTELKQFAKIHFHIVIGAFAGDTKTLERMSQNNKSITLYRNVTMMRELMQQCDVAISAAGSTIYELCACGLPTICFAFADNQLPGMNGMAEQGIMLTAGDVRKLSTEEFCIKVASGLEALQNAKTRREYRSRMLAVTDGCGAVRVAEHIQQIRRQKI